MKYNIYIITCFILSLIFIAFSCINSSFKKNPKFIESKMEVFESKDSVEIDSIFYSQKSMGFRISNNMEEKGINLPVDPIFEFKDGTNWKEVKYKKSDVEYLDGLVLIYLSSKKTRDIFIPLHIYDIKSDTSVLYRMTQKYSIGKENREPVYDKMLIKEFRLNQEMIDDLKK